MPIAYRKMALALMTSGAALIPAFAQGATGSIQIVGRIVEGTCQAPGLTQPTSLANAQLSHCARHVAQSAQMTIQPIVQKTLIPVASNTPAETGKPQPKLAILIVEYR